jgi:SAM-dependent methyltransferase
VDIRSRFAGGDQAYLKDEQYRDPSRLAARTDLHVRYGTADVPWFEWVQRQAAMPSGGRVLEVGCGEGRLWAVEDPSLSDLAVTLTDLSVGMVGAALSRVSACAAGPAVRGAVADVQHLPFAAASFDVVVANHMLYHSSDPASAVAELARVCRDDGTLVAATNGARHLAELGELRAEVFGIAPLDDTVPVFGIESGAPMLRAVFEQVEWVDYEDRLVCTDPTDVIAFLRSVPPGEGADPDQDARMVAAVHDRFDRGAGTMVISKESGVFRCHGPMPGS